MNKFHRFINAAAMPLKPRDKPVQLILAALFLLSPVWAYAQVKGTILDENAEPLAGVTVAIKGTNSGTITDIDGNFTLDANSDDIFVIRFLGYQTQEVTVGAQSVIDVQLELDTQQLEEVIVIGYSVERKKDQLGAVAVADMAAVKDVSYPNVMKQMQGRIPGVFVDLSGNPGQGAKVRIRGITTLGNNSPLYIIDGVPMQPFESAGTSSITPNWDLGWLNPNDIESMQVLKDAASASIYGARASNGVVIITTKQAKKGKATVSVAARFSVDKVTSVHDMANSAQRAEIQWQAAVNDGIDPDVVGRYTYDWHFDPSLGAGIQGNGVPVLDRIIYPDWLDENDQVRPAGHPSSVWSGTEFGGSSLEEGMVWNDAVYQTGIAQNYDIAFSQGGDRGGVQLGLNFFDQKGVFIRTNYNRFGIRLNSNYTFANGKVIVGQNLAVTREERQWSGNSSGQGFTPTILMLAMKPILPVKTEDGRFAGPLGQGFNINDNPVGVADDNKDDRIHNSKIFGNVYLDWSIIEGLNFKTTLGVDYDNIFTRDILRTFSRGFLNNTTAELTQGQLHQTNWVFNNTLTYTKTINQHSFTVLAGTEAIKNFITEFTANGKEFALETNDYFQLDAASGERTSTGFSTGFTLFSYFVKANYSLANKYLASVTVRRDGSSRFGRENLYGVFPAVSAGWRIGDEDFMSGLGWLSDLKIRVAWGKTGNQDIPNEARFGLYEADSPPVLSIGSYISNIGATSYDIGNNNSGLLPSGFLATQTENNQLKWETTTEINAGVDFGFMNDKLTGSVDFYKKQTEDILILTSFIGTFGDGARRWANGADMETTGWELQLGYNSQSSGDWNYTISVNGGAYDDIITALPEDLWASYPGNSEKNIIGQSPLALFGYISEGIIQTTEEAQSAPQYPGIRVGALRYADLNGDNVINSLDQEYQGVNGRAGMEYGINGIVSWKNFDLALQFFGMTGRKRADIVDFIEWGSQRTGINSGSASLDAWSFVNTNTHIPALSITTFPVGFNSEEVRNAGFFNFRQLTLGYTLPQTAIGNVSWLSNLRVYFSMENLFTLYTKDGAQAWVSPPWVLDQQGGTPGLQPDERGGFGIFSTLAPKPLRGSLGLSIGF